jgi:hypothetical protein
MCGSVQMQKKITCTLNLMQSSITKTTMALGEKQHGCIKLKRIRCSYAGATSQYLRARIRVIPRKTPRQSLRKWSGRLSQITKVIKPNKISSIVRASEQITAISRTSCTVDGNEHCIPRSQTKCSSDLRDSAKQPNRTTLNLPRSSQMHESRES